MNTETIWGIIKEWWEFLAFLLLGAWLSLKWALRIDGDVTDLKRKIPVLVTTEDCNNCRLSCKEWNKLMFDQGTATFERFERLIEEERERSLEQHKEIMRALVSLNSDKRDRDAK